MTCRRSSAPCSLTLLQPALPAQHFCSYHTVQATHGAQPQEQPADDGEFWQALFHCSLTGQWGWRWDKISSLPTAKWLLSRLWNTSQGRVYCLRAIWQGLPGGRQHLAAEVVMALPCPGESARKPCSVWESLCKVKWVAVSEQNINEGTGVTIHQCPFAWRHQPFSPFFYQTSSVTYRCLLARSAFPMRESSESAGWSWRLHRSKLNQMFKYLCRNDHCHLICWLVLSYLFAEYSIIYGEIPGGSSANATSNWICWFLKVRWKLSIIMAQMTWWWHQLALHFRCKNLYLLIIAVHHHCGRWVNKTRTIMSIFNPVSKAV